MIRNRCRSLAFAACAFAVATTLAQAEVKLHALFTDNMVLQRGNANPIWGSATPGATIEAKLDGQSVGTAKADADGKFIVKLPKLDADEAKPHTIELSGDGSPVTLKDVIVGDVWVCSGQSNMQWSVSQSARPNVEISAANFPNIRLFTVPNVPKANAVDDIGAQPWAAVTPATIRNFSAVGYFFGRKLNQDLNVPIGLIHTSWGGTPAEAWTPVADLEKLAQRDDMPFVTQSMQRRKTAGTPEAQREANEAMTKYRADFTEWLQRTGRADGGVAPVAADWHKAEFDDSEWKTVAVPGDWVSETEPNGCAWYRRSIDVPADAAGQPLQLYLGAIDDADTTWFNGEPVGKTEQGPVSFNAQRAYKVPGNLVKAGRNTIAVRVWDTGGGAGLTGPARSMNVAVGTAKINLAGDWKWKRESTLAATTSGDSAPQAPAVIMQLDHQNAPASLYNGMVHPLGQFGIKGAIWYQGESNAGRSAEYERLLSTMIGAWRNQFGQGDFPFYIVGLANYMKRSDDPNVPDETWPGLREAQRRVAENVENAAMSVTIDIGEAGDIHPKNKQDVGERLALLALDETYDKDIVSRGPTLDDAEFGDGKVTLEFENVGGGLKAKGDKLASFAIAGDDGQFVWADATIVGNDKVELSAKGVSKPTRVRYAWANNPVASLFNAEGLPAEPFEAKK